VIASGTAVQVGQARFGYFVTLTGPGTEVGHKRWYQGKRPRKRVVCGCESHSLSVGEWNAQESKCWNRVRTRLAEGREMQFIGALEPQKRGYLHRHLIIFTKDVLVFSEVQEAALAAGYGCVADVQALTSEQQVARYLTKYVSKGASDRANVPWRKEKLDRQTGEIVDSVSPTYRLWSSSHGWGVTMREVRAVAAAQARQRAKYLAELVDALAADQVLAGPRPAALSPP